jgi:hypothetical protein
VIYLSLIERFKKKVYPHSLNEFWEYQSIVEKALNGDMALVVTPVTLGSSAAAVNDEITANNKFTRDVEVELQTTDGEVQSWLNGTFAIASSVTSTSGTLAIAGGLTEVTLKEGKGLVTLEYTGTWASGDVATLTVTGGSKLGYSIADQTSTDTLVA